MSVCQKSYSMSLDVCPRCGAFVAGFAVCPICGYGRGITSRYSLAVLSSLLLLVGIILGAFILLWHTTRLADVLLLKWFHLSPAYQLMAVKEVQLGL